MRRLICIILILVIPVMLFSGCRKADWIKPYDLKSKIAVLESDVVAENDAFVLSWDKDATNVSLLCKETGKVWSTTPDDDLADETEKTTLDIRVQDTFVRREEQYYSDSAKRIASEKIDNGIKITYYFDDVLISVPVCYTLREDSLLLSIDGKEICQGGKRYQLIAASPAPMMCRTSIESDNSYAFIPTGVGGIVDTKVNADAVRKQSGYNANVASMSLESNTNSAEANGFRCYGIKDGDSAVFCIAEDTAGAVGINTLSGYKIKLYSTVYPTFYFTDYDYFYGASVTDGLIKQLSEPYMGKISVGLYPLSGEKADYNGMAECYRNYLIDSGYIREKENMESSPYSVTYLGGVMTTTSIAGVPTKTLKAMTTFDEAKSLTEELYKKTGTAPVVRLFGYGESGINIGKIAGGYDFGNALGSDKSRKEFEEYCKKKDISLFTDFGVIYYSDSGNGFSYSNDAAQTAVLKAAEISPVNIPLRDFNTKLSYRLLKRSVLGDAVEKLIKTADKKDVSGISLNDLGNVTYSDYSNGSEYGVTAKMDIDTKKQLQSIVDSGHKVAVSAGTYYAAGLSDLVFDAPTEPNGSYLFMDDIPFYQMVFHGITPMYSTAINTAVDTRYKLMLAASTGTGLGFTVIKNFDTSYMETNEAKLYTMYYEDNVDFIESSVEKYADIYNSVKDSKILRYDILENNITKTTFENGVCIYANHTDTPQESPIGTISGYGFVAGGEPQ